MMRPGDYCAVTQLLRCVDQEVLCISARLLKNPYCELKLKGKLGRLAVMNDWVPPALAQIGFH